MTAELTTPSPFQRLSVLHAPPRLAVFDCSVLTSDVIAATRRIPPSSFVAAMQNGTVRGFITRRVWAEVPRVLEDRWREDGGAFDLGTALRIWWRTYVPLLYTVDTDRLPYTTQAQQLAKEDPSDVGMLQLHGVLGPAALVSHDRDLQRSGLAHENWIQLRSAVGQVGKAEGEARAALQVATLAVEGTARTVVATARAAWKRPMTAVMIAAAIAAGGFLTYRRSRSLAAVKIRPFLREVGQAVVTHAAEVHERYERGTTVWADAERGSIGEALLHQVARVLACSPEPMTRTEILQAVPGFPGHTHIQRMYNLYALLRTYPMFCELQNHRWQVGRADVGAGLA
ncbi:hypothetical protein ACGFMK_20335 [Amycolatopsis sp. NPDC049252]|uniref:hypothetical protein n=1 Tax=Amycolatopsis sp. NPDC049252 TaxID=3363933 RepID=UPI0037202E28